MPRAAGPGGLAMAAIVSSGSSARGVVAAALVTPLGMTPRPPPAAYLVSYRRRGFGRGRSRSRSRSRRFIFAIVGNLSVRRVFASLVEKPRPESRYRTRRLGFLAIALGLVFPAATRAAAVTI